MQLVVNKKNYVKEDPRNNPWHIHELRQPGNIITPAQVTTGGYYIYKEKHGIVAIVKVLQKISENDWVGFRLMVKRVLYSPWPIQSKAVFEAGYYSKFEQPVSWHFEPCLSVTGVSHK